jgi:hypothetical protein
MCRGGSLRRYALEDFNEAAGDVFAADALAFF